MSIRVGTYFILHDNVRKMTETPFQGVKNVNTGVIV